MATLKNFLDRVWRRIPQAIDQLQRVMDAIDDATTITRAGLDQACTQIVTQLDVTQERINTIRSYINPTGATPGLNGGLDDIAAGLTSEQVTALRAVAATWYGATRNITAYPGDPVDDEIGLIIDHLVTVTG